MSTALEFVLALEFKRAWHEADERGEVGERTEAGIRAVLDALEPIRRAELAKAWHDGMCHESEHLSIFGQFCAGGTAGPCHEVHNPYRAVE